MKKHYLKTTTQIIHQPPGSRRLILRHEVVRQLSRQTLELVAGGSTTDSDHPGGCTDTTH